MQFNKYLPLAMRTNSDKTGHHGQDSLDFMHGAAGLVTEIVELDEAEDALNALEEAGDCAWFIALMCHAMGLDTVPSYAGPDIIKAEIELLDIAKRWFAYGKFSVDHKARAATLIGFLFLKLGISGDAMESNIKKLKVRYPDDFNQDDAINRDKGAEYAAMVRE